MRMCFLSASFYTVQYSCIVFSQNIRAYTKCIEKTLTVTNDFLSLQADTRANYKTR